MVANRDHKRLRVICNLPGSCLPEAILEMLRAESGRFEVGQIVGHELAEDAFGGSALDLAHGGIEWRDVAGNGGEGLVDERVDALADGRIQLRQRGGATVEIVLVELAIEALQDAVIELPFVAGVELQLVLGIVDVAHAENVLVEKLLRTLAKIFELGWRDAGQGIGEFCAERLVVVLGEEVAVEDGLGARSREQLQLAAGRRQASRRDASAPYERSAKIFQ